MQYEAISCSLCSCYQGVMYFYGWQEKMLKLFRKRKPYIYSLTIIRMYEQDQSWLMLRHNSRRYTDLTPIYPIRDLLRFNSCKFYYHG